MAVESTTKGGITFHVQVGEIHNEYLVNRAYNDKVHTSCSNRGCNARMTFFNKKVRVLQTNEDDQNTIFRLDDKDPGYECKDSYAIKSHSHTTKCKSEYFSSDLN